MPRNDRLPPKHPLPVTRTMALKLALRRNRLAARLAERLGLPANADEEQVAQTVTDLVKRVEKLSRRLSRLPTGGQCSNPLIAARIRNGTMHVNPLIRNLQRRGVLKEGGQ